MKFNSIRYNPFKLCHSIAFFALALAVLASSPGCGSDDGGTVDAPVADAQLPLDDAPPPDAPLPDAPPPACVADQTFCEGDVLMTCDADGSGPVDDGEPCFVCDESGAAAQCLYASNVPAQVYDLCAGEAFALAPASGRTVTISEPSADVIQIDCGGPCDETGTNTTIEASHVVTGEGAWFCLESVSIPTNVTVNYEGGIAEPIIWLVDGAVEIDGTVDLSGGTPTSDSVADGGPGGFAGRSRSRGGGLLGRGPCRGNGGARSVLDTFEAGGGGGGGGFGGAGGAGGDGTSSDGLLMAAGGRGGLGLCGTSELIPLLGGSSGGTGADGGCVECGWPSGGGGGALEIAARDHITISGTGTIVARGGDGLGFDANPGGGRGGGGGGGAGGALLLESRALTIAGGLFVDGGNGGQSAAGAGGAGATAGRTDGLDGMSSMMDGDGGAGGGGGSGRIRLNTPGGSFQCSDGFASPGGACSAGALNTEILPAPL